MQFHSMLIPFESANIDESAKPLFNDGFLDVAKSPYSLIARISLQIVYYLH